jgi:hypothetical protein
VMGRLVHTGLGSFCFVWFYFSLVLNKTNATTSRVFPPQNMFAAQPA